jgi:S-formylglutathione hydrolase FrmB
MPVVVLEHSSRALAGNPLGDPATRRLHLIVPEGAERLGPLPCLWWLAGQAGVGRGMLSDDPWQEGLEERLLRLEAAGMVGKMIVALPDVFTRFGGSQYLGSSAIGDYETYLLEELRALVDSRFSIRAHAIAGKSSGGYGAIVHAMRRPELFRAVGCHSGDMGFRLAYTSEIISLMNAVHEHRGVEAFVAAFEKALKKKEGRWLAPVSALALASVYSPDPDEPFGIALPFDLTRGEIDEAVFARWLALDPVNLIDAPEHRTALGKMALVFVDCGKRDEYHLQWGARAFHRKLDQARISHVYEEFDDGHRNTSYRLDVSLPLLYRALTA